MTIAAQLVTKVVADTKDAENSLDKIGKKSSTTGDKLKGALGSMLGIAGGFTAANLAAQGFSFLKDQIGDVFAQAEQAQNVMAETNQILADTHGKAGMSAQAIGDLAKHMSEVTPFDDKVVQSTENMLLTFTNIGKKTFPDATQAALDLATKLHEGPEQAAVQLGKALNDPAQGYSALQRAGVTFSAGQIKAMKSMQDSGNVAGAQKIILGELEHEMGHVAEAAGTTTAGKMAIMGNKIDDAKQKIGMALLPALGNAATAGMNLADKVQVVIGKVGEFAAWLQAHQPVLDALKAALIGISIAVGVALIPVVWGLVTAMGTAIVEAALFALPFILVGLAIGALILGIKALIDHGAQVKAFLGGIKDAVLGFIGGILGAIGGFVGNALGTLGKFKDFLGGVFSGAFNGLKTLIGNVWNGITGLIKGGINLIIGDINTLIRALDSVQIHIPSVGIGPVHTPAFNWGGLGIPQIPYLASGGDIVRGGVAVVGERGPELVSLPAGAQVAPHGSMPGGGFGSTIHIHGADANQVYSELRRQSTLLRMSGGF